MARIRSVKPKFWDDSKLKNISRDARLLFIGMWTFADDLGVLLADQVWIKSKVFPYDDLKLGELESWINEIKNQLLIVPGKYHNENFYLIKNFTKHQVVNKPNKSDIHIPKDCISVVFVEQKINPVVITEQSRTSTVSIEGGKDRIGEDRSTRKSIIIDDVSTPPIPPPEMTGKEFIEFSEKMKKDKLFTDPLFMSGIKPEDLEKWILNYHVHIVGESKINKDFSEYKRHFKNWLKKQDYQNSPPPILPAQSPLQKVKSYIKPENETNFDKYKLPVK